MSVTVQRNRCQPFANKDQGHTVRPHAEPVLPDIGDALPDLRLGIVIPAGRIEVFQAVEGIGSRDNLGRRKTVLDGHRHSHIHDLRSEHSGLHHACAVLVENDMVALLDEQAEQRRAG